MQRWWSPAGTGLAGFGWWRTRWRWRDRQEPLRSRQSRS